jgi:hypothetical protein
MKMLSDKLINDVLYGSKTILEQLKSVSIRIEVLQLSAEEATLQVNVFGDDDQALLYFDPKKLRKGDSLTLDGIRFEYEPGDIRFG